jgi:hypothetical protein
MIRAVCIMPTLPDRVQMLMRAVECIRGQQKPEDWKIGLVIDPAPADQVSLGSKLNRMIEATDQEFIVLTDDDDIHAPHRVTAQVQPLIDNPALLITGTSQIIYREEPDTGKSIRFQGDGRWIGGLAFRRSAWDMFKFEDVSKSVDTKWLKNFKKEEKLDLEDDSLFIGTLHAGNTCKKNTNLPCWKEIKR